MLRPPTIDIKEIVERREQDQVFGLLLALDESYFGLVYHILRFEKLPTLNQVCMMFQTEEGSRGLFKGSREVAHVSKGKEVGLVADKKGLWCDHCKKSGHTRDKCWTLYPHLVELKIQSEDQDTRVNPSGQAVSILAARANKKSGQVEHGRPV
ncbi:hypothetical protein V5N11_014381 [Cardamine amara subsp. amara]|uniref:Uncharacterized protein n=1 Tax=Cardamine amara subsp. amara TaxID=228776 RepID=A0ABD1AUP4_CARAN